MKCVNCPSTAVYTLVSKSANPLNYCALCLPPHLQVQAVSGQFPLKLESIDETTAELPKKTIKKAASKPKVEEVAVESVEELTEEEV